MYAYDIGDRGREVAREQRVMSESGKFGQKHYVEPVMTVDQRRTY